MMKRIKRLFNRRNSAGFTLVEVIVATALLGVLLVGIIFFISPVFQNVETEGQINKANRAVTTMEWYISKTLRSSVFAKAYSGVDYTDLASGGYIFVDATSKDPADPESGQLKDMIDLVNSAPKNYELRCLSFLYVEDTNNKNSSFDDAPYKYMVYNEKVTISASSKSAEIDKDARIPVFEACFYEDIYPEFAFNVAKVYLERDASGEFKKKTELTEDDFEALPAEEQAKYLPLTPYIKMDINIYGDEGYATTDFPIFRASSIIEVNNVKHSEVNKGGYYKLFDTDIVRDVNDPATPTDKRNIFVFYVARKLGTTQKTG